MLDHVDIRVADRDASRRFYSTVLGEPSHSDDELDEWQDFGVASSDDAHPVTGNLHVAFAAASWHAVDAFRTEHGSPIDHLWLRVADLEASRRFQRTVAAVLGVDVGEGRLPGYVFVARNHRHIALIADGRAPATNVHVAFPVAADDAVAEFHRVALEAGYRDNGGPRERPQYHAGYVGAFVLDPDGNNVEAVNHNR